jgi:hypothetical protein
MRAIRSASFIVSPHLARSAATAAGHTTLAEDGSAILTGQVQLAHLIMKKS